MMKLQEKGTFEYLKRKKNQNLLVMLISFAVVFAVFLQGWQFLSRAITTAR